jgi:hypothetical protein
LQNADIILVANAEQIIDLQNAIKCRYKYWFAKCNSKMQI